MSYLTVATAALARGLAVTPLLPGTKEGELWGWNRNPSTTLSEITMHAKELPMHDVAIVSKGRGLGNLMFFDDDAGVAERIEHETGHKLPTLCVVQTRPQSAPWKAHHYFKQTAYSIAKLPGRQTNIKDLTRLNEKGKHPTQYDLKAIGKAGLVVAPGTSRLGPDGNMEFYTTGEWHIVDVPQIPDWLVDWFVADIHRYNSDKSKAQAKDRREKAQSAHESPGPKANYDVTKDGAHSYLRKRSGSYASLGTRRSSIERLLAEHAEDFCEGGKELAASKEGKAKFHRLAFDPKLNIIRPNRPKRNEVMVYSDDDDNVMRIEKLPNPPELHDILVATMRLFPGRILATEGYDRLEQALKGTEFTLGDRETTTSKRQTRRAREATGFEPENEPGGGGVWWWVRAH